MTLNHLGIKHKLHEIGISLELVALLELGVLALNVAHIPPHSLRRLGYHQDILTQTT